MSDPTTPAVKGTQPTCPQYIELHGYCALTQGHDGDCELTNDAADVERLQAKVAELEARCAALEADREALIEGKVRVDSSYPLHPWFFIDGDGDDRRFPTANLALAAYHASRSTTEKNDA